MAGYCRRLLLLNEGGRAHTDAARPPTTRNDVVVRITHLGDSIWGWSY